MKHIAALYTCHNRKQKTLNSLYSLFEAHKATSHDILLEVYLTDDGSTDGTGEAVRQEFPMVRLLHGDGSLFWAEGMRHSWTEALKKSYDGFLLLNDDVELYPNMFDQLLAAHDHSLKHLQKSGIYIGATEDRIKGKLTYSGSVFRNRFLATYDRLVPNGTVQKCDMANANIMLVSRPVVDQIGILSEGYSHGMADYDYTLTANQKKIPVLVAPKVCGHCINDHKDKYLGFAQKTLKERRAQLNNPTGLAFASYKKYMWKFFPFRYPFVVFFGWFKLYFPSLYLKYFRPR
jgi:GT2 family glycosyltransferase